MKKAFTLIELIISTVILWILIVLIFNIYSHILNISTRVENEKIITNEVLFLSQTVQNFVDAYDIDFQKYYDSLGNSSLISTYWFTWAIHLKSWTWSISIYATWDCEDTQDNLKEKFCWIQMKQGDKTIDITDKNKVYFRKFYFKIIPYQDGSSYYLNFEDISHNGFWMFSEIYIKNYKQVWWPFDVKLNYENFFNIRQYQ